MVVTTTLLGGTMVTSTVSVNALLVVAPAELVMTTSYSPASADETAGKISVAAVAPATLTPFLRH